MNDTIPESADNPGGQPWRRFVERAKRIKASANKELVPDALAMCRLDERTDPDQVGLTNKPLGTDIITLTRYLMYCALHRAACALYGMPCEAPRAGDAAHRAVAARVEECFRAAICEAFPSPLATSTKTLGTVSLPPFDQRGFERAMARFAAGELGTGRLSPLAKGTPDQLFHDGVPDGPNWFGFAESALLFVRLGLNPAFWSRTLPVFVASTVAFTANYWNRTARKLEAYACGNFRPLVPGTAVLAMLHQYHGAADLPRLMRNLGDQLAMALRDEQRLVLPTLTPAEFA